MWTILVNYDEYAQGVFKSEQYAREKLVDLVRELEPDEDIPDYDTAYDYTDGYYRVLEIKGVLGYEIQSKGNRNMVCRCEREI